MVTSDNTFNEIGDVIQFRTPPIFRLLQLNGYTDSTTGETDIAYLDRQFCYSFDGIVFTAFEELSDEALQQLNGLFTQTTTLTLQFQYTRIGTDQTNPITIVGLTLNGLFQNITPNYQLSMQTIFADLVYDNTDVWNLMFNIAQKMYEDGIIPTYIIRNQQSDDITVDKDYLDFWEVVAKLFGVLLVYAYQYTVIYWQYDLLKEYLQEKDILLSQYDDLPILQLIAQRYFDELRVRGTAQIFLSQDYEYPMGDRYIYESPYPPTEVIRPALPVQIDGVLYGEVEDLPDGWVWLIGEDVGNSFGLLISPDKNYHYILFANDTDGTLDVCPTDQQILLCSNYTGVLKRYNGEYLRLIEYLVNDEFIQNVPERKYIGWCLGNSSPSYRGLRPQYNSNLVKVYDSWQ